MKYPTLKNHYLVATPSLKDDIFSKSVVYIFDHNEEGAMGLIINKPINIQLESILDHLKIKITDKTARNITVYSGGPVSQEHGFVLHDIRDEKTDEDVMITASKDMLMDIAKGKGPKNYLVMLGYSGWNAGQLELELARNDWLIAPFNPDLLFKVPIGKRWAAAAEIIGFDITQMGDQIGHA